MTNPIFTILLLLPTLLFSQKKKSNPNNYWTVGIIGGINYYNANPKNITQTNFFGLDCSYNWPLDPRHLGMHRFDTRYIPSTNSKVNDSLSYTFNSFSASYSLGADIITKKHFRLPILLGFTYGQTTLKTNDNHTYKNNILAPKATIQTSFMFTGNICTLGFEYNYDVSRSVWTPKIDNSLVTNFNQSNITIYLSLAFQLSKR